MRAVSAEAARTFTGTSLTGSFQNVGAVTTSPGRIIIIMSDCDTAVVVSWDGGTTSHFSIPASGAIAIDVSANKDEDGQVRFLETGTQFSAKHDGSVPTEGKVRIMVIS
jgi:hypothetical protein